MAVCRRAGNSSAAAAVVTAADRALTAPAGNRAGAMDEPGHADRRLGAGASSFVGGLSLAQISRFCEARLSLQLVISSCLSGLTR
jgi:hypothetical protein